MVLVLAAHLVGVFAEGEGGGLLVVGELILLETAVVELLAVDAAARVFDVGAVAEREELLRGELVLLPHPHHHSRPFEFHQYYKHPPDQSPNQNQLLTYHQEKLEVVELRYP